MSTPSRDAFRYFCPIPTRWGDEDRIGHINNAKYFTYDEQARISYLRFQLAEVGIDSGEGQLILARVACDFLQQLRHPAHLDYGMRITRIGNRSLNTEGAAFVGDQCYARTSGVLVWFDYDKQASAPIPDKVRQQIQAYEIIKPDA